MKFSLFFFLFFFSFFSAQKIDSSDIECKYLVNFLTDTLDIHTKNEEITSLRIAKNGTSIFRSNQKAVFDSLSEASLDNSFKNPVNGNVVINLSNIKSPRFIPEVYKKDNNISIFDEVLGLTFEYPSVQKIKWKLEDETKIISTYKCRKAVGKYRNKEITAWYTEDIPISEGPYTFKGLPGLVIEAYDAKDYYHFTMISLKNVKKPILTLRNESIQSDYQKFLRKRNDFKNDPSGAYFVATGRTVSKEQKERITKMHRKKNNYLD